MTHPEKIPPPRNPLWPGYMAEGTPEYEDMWRKRYEFIGHLMRWRFVVTLTAEDGAQFTGYIVDYPLFDTENEMAIVPPGETLTGGKHSPGFVLQDHLGNTFQVIAAAVVHLEVHADPSLMPPLKTFVKGTWTESAPMGVAMDLIDDVFEED